MAVLEKLFHNFKHVVRFDEPLAKHTSFKIGGPADVFAVPQSNDELISLVRTAATGNLPVFVLGHGANILVSDKGIHGLVISMEKYNRVSISKSDVRAGAGIAISLLAKNCAAAGLKGLERFYSMPGSVGGSVWMNARCYETSVSDILMNVTRLDKNLEIRTVEIDKRDFDYKKSPFQTSGAIILEAVFAVQQADPAALKVVMEEIKRDRESKGHFSLPSAGSVFKNNRAFGRPTGKLIDALGLKGYRIGGARISPHHANIIINEGGATAGDVRALVKMIEDRVRDAYGFSLEREILYRGEE